MRKKLQDYLENEEKGKIYSSYDVIGKVAIIKVPNDDLENAKKAAQAVKSVYRNLQVVFVQMSPVNGDFRTRKLLCLEGENNAVTVYKEFGCSFMVDVENCYFSPRLSNERSRIASLVEQNETVVNMFAGVGCFSIMIAKKVAGVKVYSIDINPTAFQYMQKNIKINHVDAKVVALLGDSKEIINAQLKGIADRVLMPLPEKALEYLPTAVSALKPSGGWIHYHDFEHATKNENPLSKSKLKVAEKLDELGVNYSFSFSRVIRSTGPNWHQTVLDIQVTGLPSKF